MRAPLVIALTLFGTTSAFSAEPSGCDKFKWPIERDRAALTAPSRVALAIGSDLTTDGRSVDLKLRPSAEANLPMPPERKFPPETFASFVKVAAPTQSGSYTISLSGAVWLDVVQDGKMLKPAAFSGATDCDGIRKTMKFDLAAQPVLIQISGGKTDTVAMVMRLSD